MSTLFYFICLSILVPKRFEEPSYSLNATNQIHKSKMAFSLLDNTFYEHSFSEILWSLDHEGLFFITVEITALFRIYFNITIIFSFHYAH